MKRQIVTVIGVFGLLLAAACANAQSIKVKANVPFDFAVDKTTLPAGTYYIEEVLPQNSTALAIRNFDAGISRMLLSTSARSLNASENTRLVFHRYGERYFLAQIWVEGEAAGRQVPMSKRESETAKLMQRDDNVIVLASLQ
jgi:hypothetical protein